MINIWKLFGISHKSSTEQFIKNTWIALRFIIEKRMCLEFGSLLEYSLIRISGPIRIMEIHIHNEDIFIYVSEDCIYYLRTQDKSGTVLGKDSATFTLSEAV